MRVQTGKGTIPWMTVLAIWSVSAVVSLPGLAISPILGDLNKVFPRATDLEIQMLTSLPSVLIIPFMLLAGRLSVTGNKFKLLVVGLTVFFLSGFACLFINQMWLLILVSCLTGIGAGIIIPLSTGYIVDYFTGDYRVRQLGYSSSINNLTLVLATVLASYLANVDWHLPFLVYTLPAIPLILSIFIRRTPAAPEPVGSDELKHKKIDWPKLAAVMGFYFLATFLALAITFYISFLVDPHGNQNSFSGLLVSLFFLAIMLPGFFLSPIIRRLRGSVNLVSLIMICAGLLFIGLFKAHFWLIAGCTLVGLGYGIIQPIIYDKAAVAAPPQSATLALSIVMSVNYLAIVLCPFIIDLLRNILQMQGERFPFILNAVLAFVAVLLTWRYRNSYAFGLDRSYYQSDK